MTEGGFQAGNQLWRLRAFNAGPKRLYENGSDLAEDLAEYFEWCLDNPIEENVVGWYQGDATDHTVTHARAMTIKGACAYLGLQTQLWNEWKRERPDLKPALEWAEAIMYEQKFTGAAAGLFNANIIARDLGLAEHTEFSNPDGNLVKPTMITFVAPDFVSDAIKEERAREAAAAEAGKPANG